MYLLLNCTIVPMTKKKAIKNAIPKKWQQSLKWSSLYKLILTKETHFFAENGLPKHSCNIQQLM